MREAFSVVYEAEENKVYQVGESFVISSHQVWIPGSFDSLDAARYAFQFSDEQLQRLQDRKNDENGGTDGTITLADLHGIESPKDNA